MPVTSGNWETDYREASRRNADPTVLEDIYRNYQASGGTKSASEILAAQQGQPQTTAQPSVVQPQSTAQPQTTQTTAQAQTGQQPNFQHISAPDTSAIRTTLDQWLANAQKQSAAQIDESVRQNVNELARTQEDADAAYDRQRDQVNIEEARAKDNQALYNAARGDRGGIGAAQYDSVMNAAALNRQTIRTEQTKMQTDILRQIANIRAQGDFQKEQSALEAANQYLKQLHSLEQLELTNQLTVDQFNAQVDQARAAYELQLRQLEIASDQFNRQFAYQQERDAIADARYEDETQYNRGIDERNYNYQLNRDAIADARYADETQYNRGIDERNYNYQLSRDAVADARDERNFNYQQSRDAVADSQWQQGFQYQQSRDAVADARDERNYNYQLNRDAVTDSRYTDETAYNRALTERGNAYTMAMTALNAGFIPDSDTLKAAGISPEYAKQYKEYVDAQAALKAASVTGTSGAGLSVYEWLRNQGATDQATAYEALRSGGFTSTDAKTYAQYYEDTWLPANPAPVSSAARNIVNIAAREIGYTEGRIGQTSNYTKYGEWMGTDGESWCVSFVQWVFNEAGMLNLLPARTASTTSFVNAAKRAGQWVTSNYREGDVVCFDYDASDGKFDHMGIVKSVNADGTLTTIEGNSGNAVREVTRTPSKISGAFRPNYGNTSSGTYNSVMRTTPVSGTASSGTTSSGSVAGATSSGTKAGTTATASGKGVTQKEYNSIVAGIREAMGRRNPTAANALLDDAQKRMTATQFTQLTKALGF